MKTVIEMAREAGFHVGDQFVAGASEDDLERFAELVRADERNRTWTQEHWTEYERSIVEAEREACAKFIEDEYVRQFVNPWREDLAAAIRARSNT